MATIQMWPQNLGLRNSVSFNGRTYSSIPGVPIPVPDFDVAVLQANGWTTYSTIAGKTTITMLPSANVVHHELTFNGRTYATTPGVSIEVQPFDAPVLQANGWTLLQLGAIPVNTVVPTITGTAQVGQTLTATNGTWTNSPTGFIYKWNRAGTPIVGATAPTYVPVSADVGNILTVSVTAGNGSGSSTPATSAPTSAVTDIAPTINTAASIPGTPQVGVGTTAVDAVWNNSVTSLSYQWKAAGVNATGAGATSLTYIPVVGDVGKTLTITVTATNTGGTSAPSTSAASVATIDIIPTNSVAPTISGTAQVGQTLAAATGIWTHSPTSYAYQWKSAGVNATGVGATTANYTAATADIGNTLTVAVTAINSGGQSAPVTSAATAAVISAAIPVNTALPAISGTAQVGQTLTASNGTWANSPTGFAYQWQREGSNIGATSQTYLLAAADLGTLVDVVVTASNGAGSSLPAISALAGPVISTTVFYVSSSTGLDTNPGTFAAPWQTLTKVNGAALAPGTSVLFKRGDTWRDGSNAGTGRLKVKSGTSGNPIVYDAYGTGPNPTILGSVAAATTADWINISGNIWKSNHTFPLIGANPNGRPFDNANDAGSVTWGTYPNRSYGVMEQLPGQSDASLTTQGKWLFNTTDLKIHIFSVGNPATAMPGLEIGVNASMIETVSANNFTVQNFTLYNGAGHGINCGLCTGIVVRDNIVGWIGGGNLGGGGVRYGNGTTALTSTTNAIFERNWVFECYDGGVTQETPSGGCANITYRNNVVYNCTASNIELQCSGGAMSNILCHNNTTANPGGWGSVNRPGGGGGWGLNLSGDTPVAPVDIYNNVFANTTITLFLGYPAGSFQYGASIVNFDYNSWSASSLAAPGTPTTCDVYGGADEAMLAVWKPSYTIGVGGRPEAHGFIDVAPQLVDYTGGDIDPNKLAPAAGSPLRGAGKNLFSAGVVWDFNKKPRPSSGPFTIGAFQ